jgi:hypothetical protein
MIDSEQYIEEIKIYLKTKGITLIEGSENLIRREGNEN